MEEQQPKNPENIDPGFALEMKKLNAEDAETQGRLSQEPLLSTSRPDLPEALDFRIRNSLATQAWRLALIDSAILFECWIQPLIRQHYFKLLRSNTKVNSKLSYKDAKGKNRLMPIGELLASVIQEAFGFAFQHTEEYKALLANTLTPRNKLVHGSPFVVNRQAAESAYASCLAAIKVLQPHLAA